MNRQHSRARHLEHSGCKLSGVLGGTILVFLASSLGCQAIADIPDVSFSPICKEYCDQVMNVCPGDASQYPDRRTCLEVCTLIDESVDGSTSHTGPTIQCRLDTLQDAAGVKGSIDVLGYCTQAGPGGGTTCTFRDDAPDCEGYCALFDLACNGDTENPFSGGGLANDQTGTQEQCIERCQAIPPMTGQGYTWKDGRDSGDTLGCRLYFVSRAVADPEAYCTSAGIRPSGTCQTEGKAPTCPNFCLALTTACTGELAVYEGPGTTQCEAVCNALTPGSKIGTPEDNSVGCRNAHAFNALLVEAEPHCPHTGPLGANVCGVTGNCEAYCFLSKAACPVDFVDTFTNDEGCLDQCSKLEGADLDTYSVADAKKGGDTVQCRGLAVSRVLALPESERAAACAPVFGGDFCSDG